MLVPFKGFLNRLAHAKPEENTTECRTTGPLGKDVLRLEGVVSFQKLSKDNFC